MSKSARYEWQDQQAVLSQGLKSFLLQPGDAEMASLLAAIRDYAEAAKQGRIEIPQTWTAYD